MGRGVFQTGFWLKFSISKPALGPSNLERASFSADFRSGKLHFHQGSFEDRRGSFRTVMTGDKLVLHAPKPVRSCEESYDTSSLRTVNCAPTWKDTQGCDSIHSLS